MTSQLVVFHLFGHLLLFSVGTILTDNLQTSQNKQKQVFVNFVKTKNQDGNSSSRNLSRKLDLLLGWTLKAIH